MLELAEEPGLSSGRLEFQNIRTEGVGLHATTCWNSAGDTWTGGLLDPAVGGLVLASGQTRFPLTDSRNSAASHPTPSLLSIIPAHRGGGRSRGGPSEHHRRHLLCPAGGRCKAVVVIRLNNRTLSPGQARVRLHSKQKENELLSGC